MRLRFIHTLGYMVVTSRAQKVWSGLLHKYRTCNNLGQYLHTLPGLEISRGTGGLGLQASSQFCLDAPQKIPASKGTVALVLFGSFVLLLFFYFGVVSFLYCILLCFCLDSLYMKLGPNVQTISSKCMAIWAIPIRVLISCPTLTLCFIRGKNHCDEFVSKTAPNNIHVFRKDLQ